MYSSPVGFTVTDLSRAGRLAWVCSSLAYDAYEMMNDGGYGITGWINKGSTPLPATAYNDLRSYAQTRGEEAGLAVSGLYDIRFLQDTARSNTNALCAVLVLTDGERVPFVAFAGTRDYTNWRTNLKIKKVPATRLNGEAVGMVHRGFQSSYKDVSAGVRDWCAGRQELVVAGHSLGSALSQLCAYDLSLQGHRVYNCTLAPPRVGDSAWADHYNDVVDYAAHFHVDGDPVPNTPLRGQGFEHTKGHFVFYPEKSLLTKCPLVVKMKPNTCKAYEKSGFLWRMAEYTSNTTKAVQTGGLSLVLQDGNCARLHRMTVYLEAILKSAQACD